MTISQLAKNLPLVVIEEHREALTALIWARDQGATSASPVHFYNVDSHADLDIPRLTKPISQAGWTIETMRSFVDHELSISSFIWMGAYLGLIDELSWLRPLSPVEKKRPKPAGPQKLIVATLGASRTEFITLGARTETDHIGNDDRRTMTFQTVGQTVGAPNVGTQQRRTFTQDANGADPAKDWVLSIDLDYFSCLSQPHNPFRLNVTKETYEAVMADPRHPLRLSVYHHISTVEDDDGYGILFDQFPEPQSDLLKRDKDQIAAAILELKTILTAQIGEPSLIIIARSRLSGFTPADQWEHIEKSVLVMLESVYDYERFEGDKL